MFKEKRHYLQPWISHRKYRRRSAMSVNSGRQFRSIIFRHNVEIGKGAGRRADLGCVIRERSISGQQSADGSRRNNTRRNLLSRTISPYASSTNVPINNTVLLCILKLNSSCRIIIHSAKLQNTRIRYYI